VIRELAARARPPSAPFRAQLAVRGRQEEAAGARPRLGAADLRFASSSKCPTASTFFGPERTERMLQFNSVLAFDLADRQGAAPPNVAHPPARRPSIPPPSISC